MEENKTIEKKELGTQWLGFLYRFTVLYYCLLNFGHFQQNNRT